MTINWLTTENISDLLCMSVYRQNHCVLPLPPCPPSGLQWLANVSLSHYALHTSRVTWQLASGGAHSVITASNAVPQTSFTVTVSSVSIFSGVSTACGANIRPKGFRGYKRSVCMLMWHVGEARHLHYKTNSSSRHR